MVQLLIFSLLAFISGKTCDIISAEGFNKTEILNGPHPVEVSYATCKIMASNIETTANATIVRQLTGVCTARDVEEQIRAVERRLLFQLKEIADSLTNILDNAPNRKPYSHNLQQSELIHFEITTLNNTILDNGMRIYSYYWRVEQIHNLLTENQNYFIDSPEIRTSGLSIRIRIYANHLGTRNCYIQILTQRPRYCIHRFTILDQLSTDYHVASQLLKEYCPLSKHSNNGECTGFRLHHDLLNSYHYLDNNNMIVKLNIYLE